MMAECRRVYFTTLSPDVPLISENPTAAHKSNACVRQMEDLPDPPVDTVRLVLALFDPDEQSFPEFSYGQLIENKVGFYPDFLALLTFHYHHFCLNA